MDNNNGICGINAHPISYNRNTDPIFTDTSSPVKTMNKLFAFVNGLFNPVNYNLHNLILVVITLMCIQYIPIETRAGVSPIKVAVMAIMPFVLLTHLRINKALVIGTLYIFWLFFTAGIINSESFRASTILYAGMFTITFIVVYTAVWDYKVFTLDNFISFIRWLFFLLVGVLLIQQAFLIVGIKYFPLINLCQILNRGIGANSLTFEPSTLGRLLNILYYVILKCYEYRDGEKVIITNIFKGDLKWVSIFFIWSILTMGSGTAFIAAAVTSLYFMRGRYFLLSIPIFIGAFYIMDNMDNESFQRAHVATQATLTGDKNEVIETDGSAAFRIIPYLNTFSIDLSESTSWTGKGCNSISMKTIYSGGKVYLAHINDYGLISYIIELILVFSCCINFRSLATIYFFIGCGGGIGNISYGWGILMILACLKYLHDNRFNPDIYQ